MDRLSRNRLCVRLILLGLLNVAAYTIAYAYVGGDAWNGGTHDGKYFVRGHFLHSADGHLTEVSRGLWIYSYLHSISIWPSLAAILLSMLVLARPHILATYRDGIMGGAMLIGVMGTIVLLITIAGTVVFILNFARGL